jgi:ParB family transcriptional regulator, chromosome partitioning protein
MTTAVTAGKQQMIPVEFLTPGRYQPRKHFAQRELQELAETMKRLHVLQPLVVRKIADQRYEIIAGERRWRAAQQAGLAAVPAVIRDVPDEAAIAMSLIENIQREDLNPLEEARAFERLISEFQLTHQQVAEAVGRSRAAVSNLLRLLELAPEVAEMVERRELDMGHARALLGLEHRRKQVELAALIVKKGLSVRETEVLVRRMAAPPGSPGAPTASRDPNVSRLETELAEKLGAKVQIQHSATGRGKLVVGYGSLDELDGILAHIQ